MSLLGRETLTLTVSLLSVLFVCPGGVGAECDYVVLVKCFIEVLDEWAWTLYESQDNVVTISDQGCEHFNRITQCVEDSGPGGRHSCSQPEVIEASRTVSDLLTHRKHSGTFLKSYYLLHYACTDGRAEVKKHRSCLATEAIGKQTLSAAGYLEEKFAEERPNSADAACSLFTQRLISFRKIIAQQNLCGGEAERLMCESLKRMFTNVEAELLGQCPFDCAQPNGLPKVEEEPAEEAVASEAGTALGVNGEASSGSATLFSSSLHSISLLLLLLSILLLPSSSLNLL